MIFYWINLDTDVIRKININRLFNEYNCLNVRVQAEKGNTKKEKELACTQSHIKAIRQFLQSSDPWAIICEDDLSFELKPYWNAEIDDIIHCAPTDWEIIQLAVTVHDDTIKKFQEATTDYLPHSAGFYSTVCYAINRRGAEKIVNAMPAGIADIVLYKIAKTYTYRRPLFTHVDDVESNIHPENVAGHAQSKLTIRKWLMSSKDLKTFNVVKVEIHASHACNFTCESCSHFSNNGHKGYISVEEADEQMGLWSNRLNPQWFAILGGEPLLNPNIEGILKTARKHWKGEVEIITNGFLLPNFPNLGSLLKELNISLVISKHGNTPEFNEKWDVVMRYLADKGIHYTTRDSFSNWTRRYKGWGPNVLPYEDNRPVDSWNICPAKYCLQIFEGKLYKCPVIAYLKLQKKRWPEISPKWDRYLDYKPLEHTASDNELYDFINAKHEYICGMCPADRDQFNKPSPLITVGELLSKLNQKPQSL